MINIGELVQNVIDGEENPLKAYVLLRELEKQIKDALNEISEEVSEEASKYEKTFQFMDYEMTRNEGRKTFDFKNIQKWNEANQKVKELEAMYKVAYSSYEKGITPITDDGEVLEIPQVKYSKPSITLKKIKL